MIFSLLAAVLFFALGCSESSSPEQGVTDTSPPKLLSAAALDMAHVQATFDEELDKLSAEHSEYYAIYLSLAPSPRKEGLTPGAFGDTLYVNSAVLQQDGKTVLLTFSPSSSAGITYDLVVRQIKDLNGNEMSAPDSVSFTGSSAPDVIPPEIVDRSPAPGSMGVGVGQSVDVVFSEGMLENYVDSAFSWTGPGGDVPYTMNVRGANHFVFTPDTPMAYGQQYTVGFAANTAKDWGGNALPATFWSFTTTSVQDTTPPTVVSTSPADGSTGVPLDATFRITFSEPMDPNSMQETFIFMNNEIASGLESWTDGGKTLLFEPDSLLLPDTYYSLIILEGGISDYAGNKLAISYPFSFTTGSSMPSGSFSGTVSGDPNSPGASDPTGTVVVAMLGNPTNPNTPDPIMIGGSDVVGSAGGAYAVNHLEDGTYWPFCVKDSNGDNILDPGMGDAVGGYNLRIDSLSGPMIDSLTITGGNSFTNIDMPLTDPTTISGNLTYIGSAHSDSIQYYMFYVGAFDTTGFVDTVTVFQPLYGTEADYYNPDYQLSSLEGSLADGTYYIGAFVDANGNMQYDPDYDPAGMYEVGGVRAHLLRRGTGRT